MNRVSAKVLLYRRNKDRPTYIIQSIYVCHSVVPTPYIRRQKAQGNSVSRIRVIANRKPSFYFTHWISTRQWFYISFLTFVSRKYCTRCLGPGFEENKKMSIGEVFRALDWQIAVFSSWKYCTRCLGPRFEENKKVSIGEVFRALDWQIAV